MGDAEAVVPELSKEQEEALRWAYYRTIPQKHWITMGGKQRQTLVEWKRAHDFPFEGGPLNLELIIPWLHNFMPKVAHQLGANKRDGVDGSTRAQLAEVNLRVALLEEAALVGKLVPFEKVHSSVMAVGAGLGRALGTMRQTVGEEAMRPLMEEIAFQEEQWRRAWGANVTRLEGEAETRRRDEVKVQEAESMAGGGI